MPTTSSTEDIAFLNSGRYLEWSTQETGTGTANGVPTDGVSGINVLDEQVVKVGVVPNSGASLDFRIWIEYEGLTGFKVIDGSDRSGIDYAWTQQINVSGAERIYVEVTSIDTGSFDVQVGRAVTLPNTVLRRRRVITDWSDLGTGILGETVVYEDSGGNQAQLDWDSTNSQWVLTSTNGQWVTIEDWSSGSLSTTLWTETNDTGNTPVYSSVNNAVEVSFDSGDTGDYSLEASFAIRDGATCRAEFSFGGLTQPSSDDPRINMNLFDFNQDGDERPLMQYLLSWNDANGSPDLASFTRQEDGSTDFNSGDNVSGQDASKTYDVYGKVAILSDQINQPFYRYYDVTGGVLVQEGQVTSPFDPGSYSPGVFNLGFNMTASGATFSGGPYTFSIGRIRIKR